MKAPRILMVTRSLPFHRTGGMEAVSWDLARAFAREGSEVTFLTTSSRNLPTRSRIDGVDVHSLPVPCGRYSIKWWWCSRKIYLNEYAHRVDVVISVSAGAMSFVGAGRWKRKPIFVAQIHGTAWGEFVSKIRQRSLWPWLKSLRNMAWMIRDARYRCFNAFIAVGPAVSEDISRFPTKVVMGNVHVRTISNGIDPLTFTFDRDERERVRKDLGVIGGGRVLLAASRLHPQKGVYEALKAFAEVSCSDPELCFVIVGDGPDERRLKDAAKRLGVENRVRFVGRVERDRIGAYLSAADAFIFTTSRVEGLPMNVLEALSSGLPVIVSKHVADPRFNSIVVNPSNHMEIVEAIAAVAPSQERASRLSKEFTLAYSAAEYLGLFSELRSDMSE